MISVETLDDAIIFPWRREGKGIQSGGVVDKDGNNIDVATIDRAGQILVKVPEPPYEPTAEMKGEYTFGGFVSPLFGHFILESCTHLWYAAQRPELPILWCRLPSLSTYQRAILNILGLKNRNIRVRETTRVETLHVPQPGLVMREVFLPEHAQFLGQYEPRPRARDHGAKIWLSRSALPDNLKSFTNEAEIEEVLARNGWRIYHPQKDPVKRQLEVLGTASHISGLIGSAFHSLVFLKNVTADVTIFSPNEPRIITYQTIAKVKGFAQREVFVKVQRYRPNGTLQYEVLNPDLIYETLGARPDAEARPAPSASPAKSKLDLFGLLRRR